MRQYIERGINKDISEYKDFDISKIKLPLELLYKHKIEKEMKDKLGIEIENNKFVVKFADNTEFDITKGFSIEELMRIDYGLFLISNEEDKGLKDKIGFLINMKLNYNKKHDTNNI